MDVTPSGVRPWGVNLDRLLLSIPSRLLPADDPWFRLHLEVSFYTHQARICYVLSDGVRATTAFVSHEHMAKSGDWSRDEEALVCSMAASLHQLRLADPPPAAAP